MKTNKRYIYAYLLVLLGALVFVFCAVKFSNGAQRWSDVPDYVEVTVQGEQTDNGFMRFTLTPAQRSGGRTVCFYTNHQEVHVYEGKTEIYRLMPDRTPFATSTGCVWNFVPLPNGGAEQVTILLKPAYDSVRKTQMLFYCGDSSSVYNDLMRVSMPRLAVSFCIGALGVLMLLYWLTFVRKTGQGSLSYLGAFSIIVGLWSALETDALTLLLPNQPAISATSFLLMSLMPVPFVLYAKETFHANHAVLWKALCIESIAQTALCMILQVTGVAPLHSTAVLTHISLALMTVYMLTLIVHFARRQDSRGSARFQLIAAVIALCGLVTDVLAYYLDIHNTDLLGSISFLVYIAMLGVAALRETLQTLERGKTAEVYRQMALYDSMTDMRSRAAYDHDIRQLYHPTGKSAVVEFDLNDLKLHNDLYGHAEGDAALQQSAALIRTVFGPYGHCYRIGGDEFCVVIEKTTAFLISDLVKALTTETARANEQRVSGGGAPLELACGYAFFRPDKDTTLEDTRTRADALMYQNKRAIKENR